MNASTSSHRVPILAVALVAALLLALVAATPAQAGSSYSYKITGRAASVSWTQIDGTPTGTTFGNVHIGWLNAEETSQGLAAVFGDIEDWDCEEGETPGWGGHEFDEEPVEGACDFVGFRFIEAYDVPFTMDKKLNRARLTGRLTVYGGGHGEDGVVGQPAADVVWTGVGETSTSRYTSRWREGDSWSSETYKSTSRTATMSGNIGPMGFDPELSSGYLYTFSASGRWRSR